ncbi:MAG: hypothetical protein [Bacteriophage sp.]|nr:MAG: hypothetical protein [Bacteriophage sp.]
MEKFYIIPNESHYYQDYVDYQEMTHKMCNAFNEFAKEEGIEAKELYMDSDGLYIIPTDNDCKKFGSEFKKREKGNFKLNSKTSKKWVLWCKEREITTPRRPRITFEFNVYGRSSSQICNDIMEKSGNGKAMENIANSGF